MVADLVYGPSEPPVTAWGRALGAAVTDGLEVLLRQGALSFVRWTGQDVEKTLKDPYELLNRRGAPVGDGKNPKDTNASFLLRTALDAQVSSDLIRKAVSKKPTVTFPDLSNRQLRNALAAHWCLPITTGVPFPPRRRELSLALDITSGEGMSEV